MNIAVIGAGAIGSVIAGYLTKAGQQVTLVVKQDQVDAIARDGVRITGPRGVEVFRPAVVTRLEEKCDLVIFAVKTTDIESAYAHNCDVLDDTYVLTTQNGVQADTILGVHFDKAHMISSIVMFGATCAQPGVVTLNFEGDWVIGKPHAPNDPFVEQLAAVFRKSFSVVVSPDIVGMKWLKLFVNFNNCLPALIGRSMQETFSDMDFCRLSIMLLREGMEVVKAAHITLVSLPNFSADRIFGLTAMPLEQAAGIISKTLTGLSKEPLYGSILQSIMRKRVSEIDYINGEIVLLAKNVHTAAPLNRKVVDLVHQVEQRGSFFTPEEIKKEFCL